MKSDVAGVRIEWKVRDRWKVVQARVVQSSARRENDVDDCRLCYLALNSLFFLLVACFRARVATARFQRESK